MIAVALLLLEAVTRTLLVPASIDLRRLATHAARARALAGSASPRIAFVGSSTTERGVEPGLLAREWLAATGRPASVDLFVADGSGVSTWYWMVTHDFWKPNLRPDLLVVTYHGDALADRYPLEIGRLARHFTDRDDIPALFEHDLTTLGQRADFLLSRVSQAWSERNRLRDRTLLLLPGYRDFTRATNAVNFQHQQAQAAATSRPTYRALGRFLERARAHGVPVVFVAFPARPPTEGASSYEPDPQALDAIAGAGMLHLDLRHVSGLTASHYEDRVHLNEAGRQVYTRRLAAALIAEGARSMAPLATGP